jgi:2-methylisocitrate lyase-like PEP mutase family enzyme
MNEQFRAQHRRGQPLILPNAWDVASAAALIRAGFTTIGTTSLGVAASYGVPDGLGRTRTETVALARRLGRLPCLFTVDIESGFSGDVAEVADLAAQVYAAGAAGINLEDGRADGSLADIGRQQDLIRAAKSRTPELFINARTDTYWLKTQQSETVARVRAYREAGADGVFVPGLADEASVRTVADATDAPLNVLFLPGRHTVAGLTEWGVSRISCGSLLFRTAIHAAVTAALAVAHDTALPDDTPSYAEIEALSRT